MFIVVKCSQNSVKIGGFYNSGYYPNPNPKYWVPENLGNAILGQTSGSIFENPNFSKPELPDPNFSGNPNGQA